MEDTEKTKNQLITELAELKRKLQIFENFLTKAQKEQPQLNLDILQKYHTVFETMPIVFYQADNNGNIKKISASAARLLGYSKIDELIGKNLARDLYYYPEDRNEFLKDLKKRKGFIQDYEVILKSKKEQPVIVSTSSRYWYDDAGNIKGVEGIFVDITERKKAEIALRESQLELNGVFQNIPLALVYVDKNFHIININKRFTDLFGYTIGEIKGENIDSGIIHPPEKMFEGVQINKLIMSQGYYQCETIRKRKDGSHVPVSISTSKLIVDGQFKGLIGTYFDITERRKNEQALRKSEQKYRHLFESIQDIYYQADIEGNIIMINPAGAKILGYEQPKDVIGKNMVYDFYQKPEEWAERFFNIMVKKGFVNKLEINLKKQDGSPMTVSTTSHFIYNQQGKVSGFEGLMFDITEQKRAQLIIQKREQEFTSLFNSNAEALVYANEKGFILDVNKKFETLFGYTRQELLGKHINCGIIHPSGKVQEGEALDKMAVANGYIKFETIRKKKDGSLFPVSISGSPVVIDGKTCGIIGTFIDISQRKTMEKKLEKLAYYDALTGCCNRGYGLSLFQRYIELSKRNNTCLVIAYIDVNNLKCINDQYGHKEGDKVLVNLISKIKSTLRAVDIIVRLGGDEFLILFPGSSKEDTSILKEKFNRVILSGNAHKMNPYSVSFSTGFAIYHQGSTDSVDELIRIADQAMYKNKRKRKRNQALDKI